MECLTLGRVDIASANVDGAVREGCVDALLYEVAVCLNVVNLDELASSVVGRLVSRNIFCSLRHFLV